MTGKRGRRGSKPAAAAKPPVCPACGVEVGEDERRHLVEACAFFRAERFRDADPGHLRQHDREEAGAAIDLALGRRKRPPVRKSRPARSGT
jgi:hypothetical protein